MEYLTYTAKDFVKDSLFQKWVLDSDSDTDDFWRALLRRCPHKNAVVEEARQIVVALNFQADLESNDAFIEVWEHINAAKRKDTGEIKCLRPSDISRWLKQHQQLAALFLGILFLCGSLFLLFRTQEPRTLSYATQYRQMDIIVEPDSAEAPFK